MKDISVVEQCVKIGITLHTSCLNDMYVLTDNQTIMVGRRRYLSKLPELLTICEGDECALVNGPPTPLTSRSFPLEKNELLLLWPLLGDVELVLLHDCNRTVDSV